MAGKFELKKSKNDKFHFNLLASNGQIIMQSEMYESKASAQNGIASVQKNAVDAVIISSSDPHQSEYLADRWKDREWISGFTGSSGFVVVTNDHSGLWTDSRYFIQAEKELSNSEIQLHKIINQFAHNDFIKQKSGQLQKISCFQG